MTKNRWFTMLVIGSMAVLMLRTTQVEAITTSGTLSENEVWSGIVTITGDVTVPDALSLTILPGTEVRFTAFSDDQSSGVDTSRCELIVLGALVADGEPLSPILFTSTAALPARNDWYGIRFNDPEDGLCFVDYCTIEWAYMGVSLQTASPTLTNNIIRECTYRGISGTASEINMTVSGNEIYNVGPNSDGHGIYINCKSNTTLTMTGNIVHAAFGKGIYADQNSSATYVTYSLANNQVYSNGGTGIYIRVGDSSSNSAVTLTNDIAHHNTGYGVQVHFGYWSSNVNGTLDGVVAYNNSSDGAELFFDYPQGVCNAQLLACDSHLNTGKGLSVRINRYSWSPALASQVVDSCLAYENGNDGCNLGSASTMSIKNCSFSDNGNHGLVGVVDTSGQVTANDINGNTGAGVYITSGDTVFTYNTIFNNGSYGIYYADRIGTLIQNDIYNNGGYGLYLNNGAGVHIVNGNNIYDNTTHEIYNNGPFAVDARTNYWGVANTNQMNSYGYAANIEKLYDIHDNFAVGMVDYRGWRSSAIDTSKDPASHIVVPLDGMTLPRGLLDIEGVACSMAGIDHVDVTKDGGLFWLIADGEEVWTFPWYASANGYYNVNSQAFDTELNPEVIGPGITVEVDIGLLHTWGELFMDETWSGIVTITGDVTVPTGVTLTLLPGTIVKFAKNRDDTISGTDTSRCELIIKGEIQALGQVGNEVVFTSAAAAPSMKDWYGIRFVDPEDTLCTLDHCIIEWANVGVSLENSSPNLSNNKIRNCYYRGISGASGDSNLTLTGNEIYSNGHDAEGHGVYLTYTPAITVVFDGNEVHDNASKGIYCTHAASATNFDLQFQNNICYENNGDGIYVRTGDSATTSQVRLQDDTLYGNNGRGAYIYFGYWSSTNTAVLNGVVAYDNVNEGIQTHYDYPQNVNSFSMSGCQLYANDGRGLTLSVNCYSWSPKLTSGAIVNSSFHNNGGEGCNIGAVDSLTMQDNDVYENNSNGITALLGAQLSVFDNNLVTDNGGYGIRTTSGPARFMYNVILDNVGQGIQFNDSTAVMVHNNIYLNDGYGVVFTNCNGVNKFYYNNIFRNIDYEMYNNSTYAVDARNNWWGDVSAAQMDALGYSANIGKLYDIHDNLEKGLIDYRGWLGSAIDIDVDPASYIIEPMNGAVLPIGTMDIKGVAVASLGLDHVEASVDAGATWEEAISTFTWRYPWYANPSGSHTLRSKAIDAELNEEVPGPGVTVTVQTINHTWGPLFVNETWSGTVVITGDITVPEGLILTIEPGTTLIFACERDDTLGGVDTSRCELIVEGALIADGEPGAPITFTTDARVPAPRDWYGIRFLSPDANGTVLDHCEINYAYLGVSLETSSPILTNNLVANCYYRGISGTTSGQNILIQGNDLSHNGYNTEGHGIFVTTAASTTLTLENNIAHDNTGKGFYLTNPSSASTIQYVVRGNLAHDNGGEGIYIRVGDSSSTVAVACENNLCYSNAADGMYVHQGYWSTGSVGQFQGDVCRNNVGDGLNILCDYPQGTSAMSFTNCEYYLNSQKGLYLQVNRYSWSPQLATITLSGCTFRNNVGEGCNTGEATSMTIVNNFINDNTSNGLIIKVGTGPTTLTNNYIFDNGGYGIQCANGPATFLGNHIDHNSGYGLEFLNSTGVFHYNDINWNGGYGVRFSGTTAVSDFQNNSIYLNGNYEIYNDGTYAVNAQYCWWGEINTTQMNELGYPANISRIYDIRDNASKGEVNYNNWLTSPMPTPTPTVTASPTEPPPTQTPTETPTISPYSPTPTAQPSVFPSITPTQFCLNDGDVDDNGRLTPQDAQISFQISLGIIPNPTHDEFCSADCSGNGVVTSEDAQCIFFHYLGLECDCADAISYRSVDRELNQINLGDSLLASQANLQDPMAASSEETTRGSVLIRTGYQTNGKVRITVSLRVGATPVDAFGLRILLPQETATISMVQIADELRGWQLAGWNLVENEFLVGATDSASAIPAGAFQQVCTLDLELTGLPLGVKPSLEVSELVDDLQDYAVINEEVSVDGDRVLELSSELLPSR